jgi:hypothetical protein
MSSKVLQQYCESALTILNSQYQATQDYSTTQPQVLHVSRSSRIS